MVLICWSAWIFSERFCLWVWRLFFFMFLIISLFRRVVLKGESSHLLEAVQINWLLCPFTHYNGVVVFLPTSVACCGVSLKTHGPCVIAIGIHISQMQTLGLSKIAPGSAAKGLKTLAAPRLRGWCPEWNFWQLRDVLLPCSGGFWNLRIFLHSK